jgi:hypothetical protein
VYSQEVIKLCYKEKEELSDPPHVPPEQVRNTGSKKKSNPKKTTEVLGQEDGVVGAGDDA